MTKSKVKMEKLKIFSLLKICKKLKITNRLASKLFKCKLKKNSFLIKRYSIKSPKGFTKLYE